MSSLAASTLSVWLQAACRALTFGHLCVISGCKPHGDRVQTRDVNNYCTRATRNNHDRDHIVACPACHAQAQDHDHACSRLARFLDVACHDNDHDRLARCLDVHLSKTPARLQGCSARQLNGCPSSWGPRQNLAVGETLANKIYDICIIMQRVRKL